MTTRTGATEQTLKGTVDPPPYAAAMGGAVLQISVLLYSWNQTSAAPCLADPIGCLSSLSDSDPWGRMVVWVIAGSLLIWTTSLIPFLTGGTHSDPSIVDRLWSVQPVFYLWHMYYSSRDEGKHTNDRLLLMASLVTIWGVRLSANFAVKGGFSGGEDYRWKEVRSWFPGIKYELFNLVFVCVFQQLEILAFTVPSVVALQLNTPLNWLDYGTALWYAILVAWEGVADYQMLCFQTEKYRRINAGEPAGPYARGFIETGLWSLTRHPNYFAEVTMWWVFYLFSVAASGKWINWTILGCVFLAGLFVPPGASLDVTEALSSRKYPAYAEYQQRVSRFFPWFPRGIKKE